MYDDYLVNLEPPAVIPSPLVKLNDMMQANNSMGTTSLSKGSTKKEEMQDTEYVCPSLHCIIIYLIYILG